MKRLNFSVHVGGEMSFAGVGSYKGGKIIKFGDVDCDLIGYFTLIAFAKDSGCTIKRMWYGLPGHSFSLVKEIYGDKEVIEMVDDCENGAKLNIYCEGAVDNLSEREESDFDPSEGNSEDLAERLTSLRNRSDSDKDEESEYEKSDDDLIDDDGVTTIGEKRKIMMSEYSEYDPHCDHKNIEFKSGLCFETPRQLHYAVQQYAICNGFNVYWKRSTEKNQEAICVKGCPWRLYASWMKQENTFIVKYVLNEHKCCRSMHNRQATTKWLAEQIMKGNIRRIGSTAREIQQEVMEKYTVEVPLMKCYKACWLAEKMVDGTIEEHFQYVHSYLAALRKRYPDSVFELVIDVSESVMQNTFKRLFICFDPLAKGFLLGCRRFVGFDGTFIKHRVGGILLTAVGRDGNDGMFPIAWAVVEGENNTSWTWFLELLFKVLGVGSGDGWTFVSDQQKVNYTSFTKPS